MLRRARTRKRGRALDHESNYGLIALVLLFFAFLQKRTPENPKTFNNEEPRKSRNGDGPTVRTYAAGLLPLVGVALATFGMYTAFEATTEVAEPPNGTGNAAIFVNDPNIEVRLITTIEDHYSERPSVRLELTFNTQETEKDLEWRLAMWGTAQFDGDPECQLRQTELVSSQVPFPPFRSSLQSNRDISSNGPAQILSTDPGVIISSETTTVTCIGSLKSEIASRARNHVSIKSPRYGRAVSLRGLEEDPDPDLFDLGIEGDWYYPKRFQAVTSLGDRPRDLRLDLVSPTLDEPGEFSWSDDGLSAGGSIEATRSSNQGNELFFLGVFGGLLVDLWVRFMERARSQLRGHPKT